MKHSKFWVVCLIVGALAVFPVFGDENTVDLESRVLEGFDELSDYDWRLDASKFKHADRDENGEVTAEWPQLRFVSARPTAIFKEATDADGNELKSLGIWGRFDRRGYNWIDIYPVEKGSDDDAAPIEIPIPGRAHYLDMWVWGSNLNFYIEAYIRDYTGIPHIIKLGSIAYTGWKNLRAGIPGGIPQAKRTLPRLESLKFIKFRIWTQPVEKVDNFYVYFDQFKVLTDIFESPYDGEDLADPSKVQDLWNSESNS
ncbi:MAG: flagellar filament outer layer protein FlaA [Treponema sp.]|jgi:hypothetical protein|nr:flagellar filament outer layer protein FlaA [Treponema sp.]